VAGEERLSDREAIAAEYYRQRAEKLQTMVDALVTEADSQGMDADDLLLLVSESWPNNKERE